MGLAFGIILLWTACAAFWVAFHPGDYKSPWDIVKEVVRAVNEGGTAEVQPTVNADFYPAAPPVVPAADLSAFAGAGGGGVVPASTLGTGTPTGTAGGTSQSFRQPDGTFGASIDIGSGSSVSA